MIDDYLDNNGMTRRWQYNKMLKCGVTFGLAYNRGHNILRQI